jgi:hypothetical protein
MIKKLKELFRRFIQRISFVHPVLDRELSSTIDSKIKRVQNKQQELADKYNQILNNYLKTYFSKKYSSQSEMAVAYSAADKEWKKLCREVNSTEKLININKDAFSRQVKLVIAKTKELNEAKTEKK